MKHLIFWAEGKLSNDNFIFLADLLVKETLTNKKNCNIKMFIIVSLAIYFDKAMKLQPGFYKQKNLRLRFEISFMHQDQEQQMLRKI